jgi:hypothetical protein
MITRTGNIWDHHAEGGWIVIATNIGWCKSGDAVMGAGIAKAAADKYPDLPAWYGQKCRKYQADTAVLPYKPGKLFLFPTKPLADQPWMSWKQDASLDLIRQSTTQLALWLEILQRDGKFIKPVGVPLVGCQNGNLKPKQVVPILQKYLNGM